MKILHVIILAAVLIALGAGGWFYQEAKYNGTIDKLKKDAAREKKALAVSRDSLVVIRDKTINQLIKENEAAQKESRYWYTQAQKRSINPDYDIDFITAADVIAKSRYKPGE